MRYLYRQPSLPHPTIIALITVILIYSIIGCNVVLDIWLAPTPTPAPMTVIPSATLSPSVTPSATSTNTPTYTATPTQTDAPTLTNTATVTSSPTATITPDDPTPTREIGYITPTPMRYVLQTDTYFYACADTRCTRVTAPKGTVYEIWDEGTYDGWLGVALPVTDYLYATFWMQVAPDVR